MKSRQQKIRLYFRFFLLAFILFLPFVVHSIALLIGWNFQLPTFLQFILATFIQFGCASIFYREAFKEIENKKPGRSTLIVLGTSITYLLSLYAYFGGGSQFLHFELSSLTILSSLLGRWLESFAKKEEKESLVDQRLHLFCSRFLLLTLFIAAVTFLGWYLIENQPAKGMVHGLLVLALSCPAALEWAIPFATLMTMQVGKGIGLHFRSLESLENLQTMNVLFFNKTGFLTEGNPLLQDVYAAPGQSKEDILRVAFSLEHQTHHPFARSLERVCKEAAIEPQPVQGFHELIGEGVEGNVQGKSYTLGSLSLAKKRGVKLDVDLALLEHQGGTLILLWGSHRLLGWLLFKDDIESNSAEAIAILNRKGIHPVLWTVDEPQTAAALAAEAQITDVRSLPSHSHKEQQIKDFIQLGKSVAVLTDERDARWIADADVILMRPSSNHLKAPFIEADAILQKKGLMGVIEAIELAQLGLNKVYQNLVLAFIFNGLALPLAALGWLDPTGVEATFMIGPILILANSLLLKYWVTKAS